jgi:hypothetical protein
MSRRQQIQNSLFPFMSVLACTIGSLVVLLAVMSLTAVSTTGAAEEAFEDSRVRRATDRVLLERDRAVMDEAEALWNEVDQALEARGLEAGLTVADLSRTLAREKARGDAAQDVAKLAAELEALDKDREFVEASITVLEDRRETLPILIDPTGLSRKWKPFFIECDAGGATAYRASDDFSYFVPLEELSTSGDFGRYLRRVKAVPGALLVLLVRPDGIRTLSKAESIVRGAGIRVARLPLPGSGKLDWSLLRRAEGGA